MKEKLKKYIDANYVPALFEPPASLKSSVENLDSRFIDALFAYIDSTFEKDSQFYRKANISKQTFSYMRNHPNFQPTRQTAFACAVALELDIDETRELLRKAGLAISKSNLLDVIVECYIENGIYDIDEINSSLFEYGQPLLGSN